MGWLSNIGNTIKNIWTDHGQNNWGQKLGRNSPGFTYTNPSGGLLMVSD